MLIGLLAFLAGCSSVMGPGVQVSQTGDNMAPLVSETGDPEDDIIGARENPKIVASYGGIYSDRPAEILLAQIVSKLLAAADQPNTRFAVTILDSAEVNAFALPGGYIYVTRGILALANDESELAAVLAHEIAHVVLKHARARTNRIRTTELVDKVVTDVFGADVSTDQSSNKAKLSLAAFSQAQELAADKEGILIAGKAGFDPHAAARFLGAMGRFAQYSAGDAEQADDFLSLASLDPGPHSEGDGKCACVLRGTGDRRAGPQRLHGGDRWSGVRRQPEPGSDQRPALHPSGPQIHLHGADRLYAADLARRGRGRCGRWRSGTVRQRRGAVEHGAQRLSQVGLDRGVEARHDPDAELQRVRHGIGCRSDRSVEFPRAGGAVPGPASIASSLRRGSTASCLRAAPRKRSRASGLQRPRTSVRCIRSVCRTLTAGPVDSADSLSRRMGAIPDAKNLFYILNNLYPGDPVVAGQQYKVVVPN